MIEVIRAENYREQPWKNGGGLTREIAAAFSDDAAKRFLWRVSLATIDRDGPFSEYRGYDRSILTIDGSPVELVVDGQTINLGRLDPYAFAGEAQVVCRIGDGAARDLNVMTLRDWFVHDLEIVSSPQRFVLDNDEIVFVYAIEGAASVGGVHCPAGDTIWLQEADGTSIGSEGRAAVVRITPI